MSDSSACCHRHRFSEARRPLVTRHRRAHTVLGILALWFGPALQAQQGGTQQVTTDPVGTVARKAPYRVLFDPLARTIELQDQSGNVKERWDQFSSVAPLANIPADRPVSVVITNANPLLYDYSVRSEVLRQEDVKSCTDIGGRFLSQGFLLSSAVISGVAMPSFTIPEAPAGFLDIDAAFSDALATRGDLRLTESMLEQEMERIGADVTSFTDFASGLAALALTIEDSVALFAAKGESVPLDSVIRQFQLSLEAIQPGLSDPAQTPVIIERRAAEASSSIASLKNVNRSIESGNFSGSRTSFAAREAIRLNSRVETSVARLQEWYPVLQQNLLRLERVKAQSTRVFTVGESGSTVRRLVITSESNGEFEQVLRLHEGDAEFFTRPRQGMVCEIAVGVAWVEQVPTYGFTPDSVLIDTSDDLRRVAPVLMLHLSASSIPMLGLNLGVGFGQNKAPDLYLGGTLRLFAPVLLNVGWVWQRTPELPSGLQEGQVAPNPDPALLEDPDYNFKSTIYFGLGIGL